MIDVDERERRNCYRRPGNGCYVMVTAWLEFRHLLAAAPPARQPFRSHLSVKMK